MFYSWVGLVSKDYEIERACVEIEREIEEMGAFHINLYLATTCLMLPYFNVSL
jgi:hypothetical protein